MTTLNFSAQVDNWVKQTKERTEAVFKTATELVIQDIITRTPIDTGFLVASMTVSLQGMPSIDIAARPITGQSYSSQPFALTIEGAEIGDTIYAGFVASYAAYVEFGTKHFSGRAMVRLAAQAWPQHVAAATAEVRGL
jgi:hypothetical protein